MIKTPIEGAPLPWKPSAIHWSAQERKVVIIEMFRLAESNRHITEEALIIQAQEVLPPHRRRSRSSMRSGKKTFKLYHVLIELFDAETGEQQPA